MKSITWLGAVVALFGILGLAIPVFTTSQTKDVASLGDLRIQSTEQSTHTAPMALSASGLVLGLVLLAPELIHDARYSRASESAM
jgi:hypothetical protein